MTIAAATRFLLVDNQRSVIQGMTSMLRRFGCHDISSDLSQQSAFLTFGKIRPDIVVCDYDLPDGNGVDLCTRIRKYEADLDEDEELFSRSLADILSIGEASLDAENRTLFLLVTSRPTLSMVALARQYEVDAVLVKPLSSTALEIKFQQLISRREGATAA